MATVVLAVGTTSASSTDATAAAGDRVTIMLTSAQSQPPAGARVRLQFKRTDNTYTSVYDLQGPDQLTATFSASVYGNPYPSIAWYVSTDGAPYQYWSDSPSWTSGAFDPATTLYAYFVASNSAGSVMSATTGGGYQ